MDPWPGEAGVHGGSGQSLLQECGTSPETERDLPVILQREWPDWSLASGRLVPLSQACPSNGRAGPGRGRAQVEHRVPRPCSEVDSHCLDTAGPSFPENTIVLQISPSFKSRLEASRLSSLGWNLSTLSGAVLSICPPGLQTRQLRHRRERGELGFASRSFPPGLGTCETFPQSHVPLRVGTGSAGSRLPLGPPKACDNEGSWRELWAGLRAAGM